MSERTRLDAAYGRRGGHLIEGGRVDLDGPRCSACGGVMLCGQPGRHHSCAPVCRCNYPTTNCHCPRSGR